MGENEQVHVVMLPWLAFGHMIPFLDLSMALAKSGIHVSFISTPRNIRRLPKIPPNLSNFIDYVPLPLPRLEPDPLPENAESSMDIPADRMDDLKICCDLLQEPIKNFIAKASPNWIMVDFFPHWAVEIAQELNIPIVKYIITTASTIVFFWTPEFLGGSEGQPQARKSPHCFTVPPPWVNFPSQVACRNHEAINLYNLLYGANKSGIQGGARLAKLIQGSQAVAIRSSMEFEGDYFEIFSKITGKPVFPVGFLPPEKPDGSERREMNREEPWSKIFDWLDGQKANSVVFVGFGSECQLNREQIQEIACGVELSGIPFLWALRKPDWVPNDDDVENQALPPGFTTRTAGQGVVHVGWAPQREILGHPSIGGLFFHAGWGSIIEAMQFGHVLVFMPFIIDQPLNARMMVEKGLGIEVERDEDGSFTRNDIANALRKAMVSEEGEGLKARTERAGVENFRNYKLHENYVEKFVKYLKNKTR